jgi:hypothetical protein
VDRPEIIQGRRFGAAELADVQGLLAAQPGWSRWRLSRELARRWRWQSATGQLKDMAARTLLLKLEQRGWIVLPARRQASPKRRCDPPPSVVRSGLHDPPLRRSLTDLRPLTLVELSPSPASERAQFAGWLQAYHYLGHRTLVGENLQYLVRERDGRPVACLVFGAAAWQCADRDRYIGWDPATRVQRLHLLTNNTRFLILPWATSIPGLASHVLSRVVGQVGADWQRKYAHPIFLLETFVQRDRFTGACYRAANWQRVGQTKGRTRQDAPDGRWLQAPIKDIYLYPLDPRYAEHLRGAACPWNLQTLTPAS